MGVLESEEQLCPCYKECQEFLKLVEIKDTGLVVYCHSKRRENVRQDEIVESAVNTSRDVFILQNTRDVIITPSDLTSELEKKDISCPRCRKMFEHAQELMQKVPSIDRRKIIGVCDHCRKKAQSFKKPCFACAEIVKKFKSVKSEQKEETKKYIKIWLSRMGHLLKDTMNLDKPKRLETRAYSDLQINQLFLKSSKSRREPEVQQMFCSETHKSYTNLYTDKTSDLKESNVPEKSVGFTQPLEPPENTLHFTSPEGEGIKYTNIGSLSMESDVTFVGTYSPEREPPRTSLKEHKQAVMSDYSDASSMDTKESIKKRHDLSLREMVRSEKDTRATKRPEIFEIPKIAPWEHPKPASTYDDGISEIFIKTPKTKHDFSSHSTGDSDSVSHKRIQFGVISSQKNLKESKRKQYLDSEFGTDSIIDVKESGKRKYPSTRTSKKGLRVPHSEQYRVGKYVHGKLKKEMPKSEVKFQKVRRDEYQLPDKDLKLPRSVVKQRVKKATEPKETILKPQFSYFFPKKIQKVKKQIKVDARSSELIKDTQEKLRIQAENKKKRLEEERQQKHEEKEMKKLAREEKRQQAEEKKRQFFEDEKEYPADLKMSTESKKYFGDLDSQSQIPREKRDKSKRDFSKEDGRDLVSESELRSKQSKVSGLVDKDLKHRTRPRDKMERGKMSKHEQDDEIDVVFEKTKSRPDHGDKTDEEFGTKDFKTKREHKDKTDGELDKSKKDLKLKSDRRDTFDELPEKGKKGLKSKSGLRDKSEEVLGNENGFEVSGTGKKVMKEKYELRDKDDQIKKKPESIGKRDDMTDVSNKYPKEGRESKDVETTWKGKTEQRGKIVEAKKGFEKAEHKDKSEKEKKARSESKDWDKQMDKEMAATLKEKEKQDRAEKVQRDKEEKERLKLIKLGKDKEALNKLSPKEAAESSKKFSKDKEMTSKKSPKTTKGSPKIQESSEIEVSMSKIKIKESKEPSPLAKLPESRKKKGESPKDAEKPSRKASPTKADKDRIEKESKDKGSKKEESPKVAQEPKDVKEPKEGSSKKTKETAEEAHFKKLQSDLKKEKDEALIRQKMQETEAQKIKDLAEKRDKEERERKLKSVEAKPMPKFEPKPQPSEESIDNVEEPTLKELQIRDIKIRNKSADDLILRLVKLKQGVAGQINRYNFDTEFIKAHRCHHQSGQVSAICALCLDSELELDIESYDNKMNLKKEEITDIIIGENIFKYKPRRVKTKETEVVPLLFKSEFIEETIAQQPIELEKVFPREDEPANKPVLSVLLAKKDSKGIETEPGKGIIRYALSDRTFIDKGWTMLPTEKVVRKMNVYRMRPAHPEFDWFEHNKNKRLMTYDTGERLAEFDDNGRGRWYYRSGRLALDYYDAEETNAQQRFVIYSSGEPDERGRTHPITILATFDYLGNGIVFDHAGKIRLKYNQTEGVVLDRGIGPVSHWKWHTLNDPPVLQQVMIDTQMAHKDPEILKLGSAADSKVRPDNEEMLAIEFDNFIKEKSKKLSQKFKPFQIKMKALKINEHFSLKVLDQATIYLIFRDGTTNLKLNIGMILDHQEIVDTDTAEVGEVSNNLERFPARTDSLAGLQRSVAYAQRYERQRTERERRLRRPEPCVSADHLTAAASPPLRPPLRTLPTGSTTSAGYCNCRKPSNNLYYNTRLL